MSTDDQQHAERCGCGHLMAAHREDLGRCAVPGCDCPFWAQWGSDAHIRRTPRIAVDLHGPRTEAQR